MNNSNQDITSVVCVDDPWIDFEHTILHVKQLKSKALVMHGYGHFEQEFLPKEVLQFLQIHSF